MDMEDTIEEGKLEKTHATNPISTQEADTFYEQPNCIYIRVEYIDDGQEEGFKFSVKNELIGNFLPEDVPDGVKAIGRLVRGMLETAISYPSKMHEIGLQAQNAEFIADTQGMSDDHKEMLMGDAKGRA